MKLDRTPAGLEAELRTTGIGRFISAAFLAVWMAGWAVGEAFALWILSVGAWSLFTGQPPGAGRETLRPELALAGGLFLLFWLSLWTLGGVMAGRELLRLLFGRDHIRLGHDTLEVGRSFGLFRSCEKLRREDLHRFYRRPGRAALWIETSRGTTELTRLGTPAERAELEATLNAEFQLAVPPALAGALARGWCELLSLEGDPVLVKDPTVRRKQAWTTWILCAFISLIPLYLLFAERERSDLAVAVLFFVLLAAAIGWGAAWLSFGRHEWRLGRGRLVLQRRFGANRTTQFEAVALELAQDNSGDDGPSYQLVAVAADAPARPYTNCAGKHRRVFYRESDGPTEPRNFGVWLSQRCQLPFADLTTTEAKARDFEELKQQLANSGRLGRAALHLITRLIPAQHRPPDTGA